MNELRFTGGVPLWLVVSLALVLAGAAWLLYRREVSRGVWGWLLPTMRALVVVLIVSMLAGPELVHKVGRAERGRVVLLVDGSASMGLRDPQMKASDREALAQALGVQPLALDRMTRARRAERIVLDMDRGLLSKLRGDHEVDLVILDGNQAERVWSSTQGSTPPNTLPQFSRSEATDLSGYLSRAMDDPEQSGAGRLAFVMLTDGRHNQGRPMNEPALRARAAGVRVHAVAVGSDRAPPDLAVMSVDHPPTVFPDDRIAGQVTVIDAMPAGLTYTLEIVAGDTVLWSSQQVTTGQGQPSAIAFDLPARPAVDQASAAAPQGLVQHQLPLSLSARVVGLAGDLEPRNNAIGFQVRAVTGKRKMLILAGRPRWEMRYLDAMFSRDPRWEVTALMGGPSAGRRWLRAETGTAFPKTREGLLAYDLIVLGELPAGTLSESELGWLYDFVAKRGGGLIAIDGRRGHFADYDPSPIAPLLPKRLKQTTGRPTKLTLTARGRQHASVKLTADEQSNRALWEQLPVPGYVAPIKPRVGIDRVLVEAQAGRDGREQWPAVLLRRVGAGWVWYSAIDETWRWRRDVEGLYQTRYWHQVTNRVVESLYSAEDRYVSLGVDDAEVEAGGTLPVRVRLRDEQGGPRGSADASVYLQSSSGERVARARLTEDAVQGGRYTAALDASVLPGVYTVGVEVAGLSQADLLATTLITVRGTNRASAELADVTLNRDLLQTLAQTTGGRVLAEHEASELPALLEGLSESTVQERVTALWQSWPWFGAVVGLLAVELACRRRMGLL